MSIIFDERWVGPHGIGRFAAEVGRHVPHRPLGLHGKPMSPGDPLRLALRLRTHGTQDIFFSPGYNAPLWADMPFVFTIHDLNHLDRPENTSGAKRAYYEWLLKPACRRSAAVLTVSNFSQQRISAWSGVPIEKIFNVGNGVDALYSAEGPRHLPGYPYFLCVGNRKLHKNELRSLTAFAQAALPAHFRLLFTGPSSDDLVKQAASLGLGDRVVFLGHIDEPELPAMYRGAMGLLFVSLYEGFGLPVVEAFACGTPVITANSTSLPEIAGDAALLVDPLSVEAIAAAITRVANEAPLRATLRMLGLERAKRFTGSDVGKRVQSVLQEVATRSGYASNSMVNSE